MERMTYWCDDGQGGGEWRVNIYGREESGPHVDRLAAYEEMDLETGKMALAMFAGARAIENNKRLLGASYCYDVVGLCGGPHEISYYEAAKTLREAAGKALGEDASRQEEEHSGY